MLHIGNPTTRRSVLGNNENSLSQQRVKSLGENGFVKKKTAFDENATKTPHGKKEGKGATAGQTTQRRRRALGDISNRKGGQSSAAAGGGGKGKIVLKPAATGGNARQIKSNNNNKILFPSTAAKNRQVKFSKAASETSRGSGINNTVKPRTRAVEHDDIYGPTTRWAPSQDFDEERRSPFDTVPKEELEIMDDLFDEIEEQDRRKAEARDRAERRRDEELELKMIRDINDDYLADDIGVVSDGSDDPLGLAERLPWEIEDDKIFGDPADERRRSGCDPHSLWGEL